VSRYGILLLGGTGFIGSALAERLRQDKVPIYVVGRHDEETLAQILPQCGTVVHLASSTTPGSSASEPILELGNLSLTLRLLELMQTQPETHLIFFSSGGTVYGSPIRLPVTEDSPITPLSNHGAGKIAQEAFCRAFRAKGHAVTIVRPSNAYGPGQTLRHGFGLVRTMLECARSGMPLEIWGDGENVRDYVYIDDIVEATIHLIKLSHDSSTYNLGSSVGYSVNQLRLIVEQVSGIKLNITYQPTRKIDVRAIILDSSRLQKLLSWSPRTRIDGGVKSTWEWLLQGP